MNGSGGGSLMDSYLRARLDDGPFRPEFRDWIKEVVSPDVSVISMMFPLFSLLASPQLSLVVADADPHFPFARIHTQTHNRIFCMLLAESTAKIIVADWVALSSSSPDNVLLCDNDYSDLYPVWMQAIPFVRFS